MRLRYTLRALADLEEISRFLEKRQPATLQSFRSTVEQQIGWLSSFPYMAPATDELGVRELTLSRHPYKVYYEVTGDEVIILHIRHTRRRPRRAK
jgi:plasmid stabilization system protein ParE